MILSVTGLRKSFGRQLAVDDVAFELEPGEIVALVGPNGSGKSTVLKLLAGVIEPEYGAVRVLGIDGVLDRARAQEKIGYVPEGGPLPEEPTPAALLRRQARIRGLRAAEARHAVLAAAQAAQLGDGFDRPIGRLSPGERRRLAIAVALVHEPVLLLFDSIEAGLDEAERRSLRDVLVGLGKDRAVLLATRSLAEVESVCERAIVLYRGRVVADRLVQGREGAPSLAEDYLRLTTPRGPLR